MGTRKYTKTIYLRTNPAKHAALQAYATRRDMTVTGVVDTLIDDLLLHEVLAAPFLRDLQERVDRLEDEQ